MLPLRYLQVRLNPLELDLLNFQGYTPEEEEKITKILAHPMYNAALQNLSPTESDIQLII